MKWSILLLLPMLAIALVSFVIVRDQQGEGSPLIARQRQSQALTPAKVASVVRLAPETTYGPPGGTATCTPLGSGELHNPWRCTISYPKGRVDQYRVTINTDGTYIGDDQLVYSGGHTFRSDGEISGCCIAVP